MHPSLLEGRSDSKPGVHLGVLLQDVRRLADDLAQQRVDVVLEVGLDLGLLLHRVLQVHNHLYQVLQRGK